MLPPADETLDDPEEAEYQQARDVVDDLISAQSEGIRQSLESIARIRSKHLYGWFKNWYSYCASIEQSEFLQALETGPVLQQKIDTAVAEYVVYAFYYRAAYGLTNNIKFRKILSFTYHFLRKNKVLPRPATDFDFASMRLEEALLKIDPLGHFFYWWILREFSIRNMEFVEERGNHASVKRIIDVVCNKLLEFSAEHQFVPPELDSFRIFLKRPQSSELDKIVDYIDQRETSRTDFASLSNLSRIESTAEEMAQSFEALEERLAKEHRKK
ncbi:MAG: hypothetical protein KDK39_14435 [Leptospiraceae bacterium]|nr:hypothetical protein [Leptospiraceae bacterium]